jgi:hypothetical protein
VNCANRAKSYSVGFQGFVFLKQNDDLIEMYYLKMAKNKIHKTNCCFWV